MSFEKLDQLKEILRAYAESMFRTMSQAFLLKINSYLNELQKMEHKFQHKIDSKLATVSNIELSIQNLTRQFNELEEALCSKLNRENSFDDRDFNKLHVQSQNAFIPFTKTQYQCPQKRQRQQMNGKFDQDKVFLSFGYGNQKENYPSMNIEVCSKKRFCTDSNRDFICLGARESPNKFNSSRNRVRSIGPKSELIKWKKTGQNPCQPKILTNLNYLFSRR